MATQITMVRKYTSVRAMNKDADKLLQEGWRVQSMTERTRRSTTMRYLLYGWYGLLFPKSYIFVTYVRQA